MGPVPALPPDDGLYADLRYEVNDGALAIFDQVTAQPLHGDRRNVLSLEGVLPVGSSDGHDVWITVWRGVRNGLAPSSPADRIWTLISSPDREGRVPYLPQIVREDQPGCGVLLLDEEEVGGPLDQSVRALADAIKAIEPGQRMLHGQEKTWSYADINEALEYRYRR